MDNYENDFYVFDTKKDQKLQQNREVSFTDVIEAIDSGRILEVIDNSHRYKNQHSLIVEINHYQQFSVNFNYLKISDKIHKYKIFFVEKLSLMGDRKGEESGATFPFIPAFKLCLKAGSESRSSSRFSENC